jgi:hypothetical protein
MFLKVFACSAVVVATMLAVKDGRILSEAGLTGSCTQVSPPAGGAGAWYACMPGRLEGRPDLTRHSCTAQGLRGETELWGCPAPVHSGVE